MTPRAPYSWVLSGFPVNNTHGRIGEMHNGLFMPRIPRRNAVNPPRMSVKKLFYAMQRSALFRQRIRLNALYGQAGIHVAASRRWLTLSV